MTDGELRLLLDQALDEKLGVILACSSPEQFKKRFYILRQSLRKAGVNSYDCLSVRTSPINPGGEVWLVKNENGTAETSGQA